MLNNKTILVTGGTGSFGNAFARHVLENYVQKLVELRYDCDADTLLALVHPAGPACHTGERTCFYRAFPR